VTVRLVRSDRLYAGVPYAYASVGMPPALVFTAGACPLSPDGDVIGPGDVRAQARQAVSNLAEALAAAGCGLPDVLKTTIYVASGERADLVAAWEVISSAFGEHDVPSTLLGVTVLGYPGQLVEIEAVATAEAGSAPSPGGGPRPEQDQ
jgi:enamine deaminase RidA (YjgF/YER057c/UK114 family)